VHITKEIPLRGFSAAQLRSKREDAGLTQEALAREVGLSVYSIRSYEHSQSTPSARRLGALSAILGCPIDDFFTQPAAAA
jgi:putative transcriptional regulator